MKPGVVSQDIIGLSLYIADRIKASKERSTIIYDLLAD
jgi:hypothetical protein